MGPAASTEILEFPMPRTSPLDPPLQMLQLLQHEPIARVRLRNGQTPWLFTRHGDVKTVLTSKAFSSDIRRPGYPTVDPAHAHYTAGVLNHMDPPEHAAYRRMLAPEFMVKRIERLGPAVQQIVDERIDEALHAGPPVDLVASLAFPIPALVGCELLGAPYEDHEYFVESAEIFVGGTASAETAARRLEGFRHYLGELIDAKVRTPTDDVLGYMASTHLASGACPRDVLITLAQLLLIAGFDPTSNMIGLGVIALLEHPQQLAVLRAEPALVPNAVEEVLRFVTITHWGRHRVATEDVEIGGQLIRAGEGVIAAQDTANRDPSVFPSPNTLDVRRDARGHLAFGHGIHQCIGAALARLQLQITFASLIERLPDLALARPIDEIDFRHEAAVFGPRSLPVTWHEKEQP